MTDAHDIELSIVVLGYRSGAQVEVFAEQLMAEADTLDIDYEIILVANYDDPKDPTPGIARGVAEREDRVRYLADRKEGRMGWDMRRGMEAARGRCIAVIDGDGQMPASDIPTVYRLISTGEYDLVKTFREHRRDGWRRILLSKGYNLLFRALFPSSGHLQDINSKPKILTRAAYEAMVLESNDWFTDSEIMIQAIRLRLRICHVSTVFHANERRPSFVRLSTAFEFLRNLMRYRWRAWLRDTGQNASSMRS